MLKRQRSPNSVEADALRQLKLRGYTSPLLEARLNYMDVEGTARYVRAMAGVERVNPRMLPTQASGRWSTQDPPLVNFPAELRGGSTAGPDGKPWIPPPLIIPDQGTFWVSWDWSALHARIAVAYSKDPTDLEAFNNDWDVHTLTACGMWGVPLPPLRTKALHTDPSCAPWRALWSPPWEGGDDRRRRLAKIMRYATLLAKDEKGAGTAKDIEKEGLTRKEVLAYARKFLDSKPALVTAKTRIFEECAMTGVSYTFMGRRRRLYGDYWDKAKEGWSHKLQGGEVDMMVTCLLDIHNPATWGITSGPAPAWLVLNSHDGAILGVDERRTGISPQRVLTLFKPIVERTWDIEGTGVKTPADWKLWRPDGTVVTLK